MRKRDVIFEILLYALYLLLFYLLQAAVFPRLAIFGVRPLILPVAVVGAALYVGSVPGAFAGLAAGLLCDISLADSIAVFTVALTVIGALTGLVAERFVRRSLPTLLLCALGASVLCAFFQVFGLVVFQAVPIRAVLPRFGGQVLYSMPFAAPAWVLSRAISGHFAKKTASGL